MRLKPRQFIDCVDVDGCNDRVIGIKANALLARVPILVLEDVGAALADFYDNQGYYPEAAEEAGADTCTDGVSRGRLPVGAEFGSPGTPEPEDEPPPDPPHTICDGSGHLPDWIDANGWNDYVYYAVSTACAGTGSDCAGADSGDLLSLDGESGYAVVFGVPPDLNAYSNAHRPCRQ
ncbi:MAG: hypothetical protein U5K73_08995 [Halofilum sp. (in: g-proteobacteria)]|nr:hypothetical protein [Halofilum sp. (in: g-proteobacteria)]